LENEKEMMEMSDIESNRINKAYKEISFILQNVELEQKIQMRKTTKGEIWKNFFSEKSVKKKISEVEYEKKTFVISLACILNNFLNLFQTKEVYNLYLFEDMLLISRVRKNKEMLDKMLQLNEFSFKTYSKDPQKFTIITKENKYTYISESKQKLKLFHKEYLDTLTNQ
jgi:hypothetical protein